MKLALLNYSPYGHYADKVSNQLLSKAANERGHDCEVVTFSSLNWCNQLGKRTPDLLKDIDAVIPRFDVRSIQELEWILTTVEWIVNKGIFSAAAVSAIRNAEDKGHAAVLMAKHDIPTPNTVLVGITPEINVLKLEECAALVGGYPIALKAPYGWGGMGVIKIESKDALRSTLDFLAQLGYRGILLVQEFVQHNRCISAAIVDGSVVRQSAKVPEHDFRSNIRAGGKEVEEDLSSEEQSLTIRTAKIFGVNAATVDFVRSERGPLVLEVNACPGLYGPEDLFFARAIIKFIEQVVVTVPP